MRSKTVELKRKLSEDFSQLLGHKVSQKKAWQIFKACYARVIQETIDIEDHHLPIPGIGTFSLRFRKIHTPSNRKKHMELVYQKHGIEQIPYFKWNVSAGIRRYLLQSFFGQEVAEYYRKPPASDDDIFAIENEDDTEQQSISHPVESLRKMEDL